MNIPDAIFPEDHLIVSVHNRTFQLRSHDRFGTKVAIALDVDGAEALAREIVGFLRAEAKR